MAGWMNGTVNFGNGISRTAYSPTADVFLAKFDNNGSCQWAFNFGGIGSTANNICAGLSVDQENNPIITGQLYGTNADVDPGSAVLNLSSIGNNDCFVIKYTNNGQLWENDTTTTGIGPQTDLSRRDIFVSPNPASDRLTIHGITGNDQVSYHILNSCRSILSSGQVQGFSLKLQDIPEGIFLLGVNVNGKGKTMKFIIAR